jgi:hypothetical protein
LNTASPKEEEQMAARHYGVGYFGVLWVVRAFTLLKVAQDHYFHE